MLHPCTFGPFARWGAAALDAAIAAGAHYIDSTGETLFHPPCLRAGRDTGGEGRLWPAHGLRLQLGTGNLAGALALRDAGETASGVRIGCFERGIVVISEASRCT